MFKSLGEKVAAALIVLGVLVFALPTMTLWIQQLGFEIAGATAWYLFLAIGMSKVVSEFLVLWAAVFFVASRFYRVRRMAA